MTSYGPARNEIHICGVLWPTLINGWRVTLSSGSIRWKGSMMDAEVPGRVCVFCGRPVRKDQERALCAAHRRMAEQIDRRIWLRLLGHYPGETPAFGVPVMKDKDGYT